MVQVGDSAYQSTAGYYNGEPYGGARGGEVIAVGDDGGIVYRDAAGRIGTIPAWALSLHAVRESRAEALVDSAEVLARIAASCAALSIQCRKEANSEQSHHAV